MLNSQDLLLRVASSLCGWPALSLPLPAESAPWLSPLPPLPPPATIFPLRPLFVAPLPPTLSAIWSPPPHGQHIFSSADRPQSGFYDAPRFFCWSPQSGNAERARRSASSFSFAAYLRPRHAFSMHVPPSPLRLSPTLLRWSRSDIGIGGDDDDDLRLHLRAIEGGRASVLREMLLFLPSILPDRPKWWSASLPTAARCVIPSDSGAELEIW